MERLIWLLSQPVDFKNTGQKICLFLSLRQEQFGVPSAGSADIHTLISDPATKIDKSLIATDTSKGQFYIFPELPETGDFSTIKLAIKLADLRPIASIFINEDIESLDKNQWQSFWRVYNLVQGVGGVNVSSG